MKENKKTKYFLGLSLIGVWGLLGFRFYEKIKPQPPTLLNPPRTSLTAILKEDIFEYQLTSSYPNPFTNRSKIEQLPTSHRANSNIFSAKNHINITSRKNKKTNFPKILYKGNIVDKKGKVTAVVKIDNEFLNLNAFEVYGDVQITKIFPDSIIVQKEGTTKTITK